MGGSACYSIGFAEARVVKAARRRGGGEWVWDADIAEEDALGALLGLNLAEGGGF